MTQNIPTTNWGFPTKVWFGINRANDIANAVSELGCKNPLIITDKGLAGLDITVNMSARLVDADMSGSVFSDISLNPTTEDVAKGVAKGVDAIKEGGHDLVIALGGGSALDCAKAVAFMVTQDHPILDYEDSIGKLCEANLDNLVPVIAIPTTSGTGSEFGRASVITDVETHRKVIVYHPAMLPGLVILDPQLTVGLPAGLTAATGIDALSHSLESLCSPAFHPMADGLSMKAVKMIHDSLLDAHKDGGNIEARTQMLIASAMACIAVQKGLGGVHALAHSLGGLYGTHHGLLNAVLMPHVLRHNLPAIRDQLNAVAHMLDLGSAEAVIDWVDSLREDMGLPATLSGAGIDSVDVERIVEISVIDPSAATNPIPFSKEHARNILVSAL